MFKMKYFVLATLICASTNAGQEKTKKNFVQRHKVLTGIAAGTAATVVSLVAYSLYLQKDATERSFAEKMRNTTNLLNFEVQEKFGNRYGFVSRNATSFKNLVKGIFVSKNATPVTIALGTSDERFRPMVTFVPVAASASDAHTSDSETY